MYNLLCSLLAFEIQTHPWLIELQKCDPLNMTA